MNPLGIIESDGEPPNDSKEVCAYERTQAWNSDVASLMVAAARAEAAVILDADKPRQVLASHGLPFVPDALLTGDSICRADDMAVPLSRESEPEIFEGLDAQWLHGLRIQVGEGSPILFLLHREPITNFVALSGWWNRLSAQIVAGHQCKEQVQRCVNQLEHTGAALWEAEDRYRQLINNLDVGIVQLETSGAMITANRVCAKMFGFNSVAELFRKWNRSENGFYVVPDRREEFLQLLRLHDAVFRFESEVWNQRGERIWISETCRAVRDLRGRFLFYLNTIEDITQHRAFSESLLQSESLYQSLVEHLPQEVYRKNREGRFTFASPKFCVHHQCSLVAVLGKSEEEAFPGEASRDNARRDETVMSSAVVLETCVPRKLPDGSVRDIHLTKIPLKDAEGNVIGIQSIAWDVTDQRRAQEELVVARDAALESDRVKTRFLANMSHELRTPLNGIIGMAAVLNQDELSADQRDMVGTIETSAENLLEIINEVLDFAKLDAGRLELAPAEFDLNSLLEELLDMFHERALAKRIDLAVDWLSPLTPRVVGDAGKIRQVLVNLIGNAIKFTNHGSVRVRCTLEPVGREAVRFRVKVLDDGVGVPESMRAQLFQPFSQVDSSATRAATGTGLGLAISRQLIELMEGSIGMEGREGGGAIFWFEIPLIISPSGRSCKRERFEKLQRVLIVQQASTAVEAAAAMLRQAGLEVTIEPQLGRAAEWIRSHQGDSRSSVTLVDMEQPNGSGLDFVFQMAAREGDRLPPVILLSGRGEVLDAVALNEAGLAACIPKPLKPSRLLKTLCELDDCAPASAAGPSRSGDTAFYRRRFGLGSQRVLVVEDNPVNQKLALQVIERLGYRADPVGNGLEAVEALKRVHYPVVLMDCQMPVMDGWEAARLIRRLEAQEFWGEGVGRSYIIGLVNHQTEEDLDRCQQAGMDDCLTKPLRKEDLKIVMAQAVEQLRSGETRETLVGAQS